MHNKILTLNIMKDMPIDDIIKLYSQGYVFDNLQEFTTRTTFISIDVDGNVVDQTIIYIDREYAGVTDIDGRLTVNILSAIKGLGHTYTAFRQGYNDTWGRIIVYPNINITQSLILTRSIYGQGTVRFSVNCLGRPCQDASIIIRDQNVGKTGKDGILLAEGINVGVDIPYIVTKEGYNNSFSTVTVDDRDTSESRLIEIVQSIPSVGEIDFKTISKDGNPISGVQIILDDNELGTTNENGDLNVTNIEIGRIYTYTAHLNGYLTFRGNATSVIGIRIIPIIMVKY